jgi:hypothetical protein
MLQRLSIPFDQLRPSRHRPTAWLVRHLCAELKHGGGKFRNPLLVRRSNRGRYTVCVGTNRLEALRLRGCTDPVDCVVVANQSDIGAARQIYT